MAECIDRDALKDRVAGFVPLFVDESNKAYLDGLTDAYTLICQAPAADVVERKTGKWFLRGGQFRCSVCDSKALWLRKGSTGGWSHEYNSEPSNYCPNCGAKMEVPTDA